MIGQLRGRVIESEGSEIIVDVNGVGYLVTGSQGLISRAEIGSEVTFPVFTNVREDEIKLFGFVDRGERQLFLLLIRVNGLGPRSALDIISQVERRVLLRAIGSGDLVALTSVRGIGRKKAERIIVELKDIVLKVASEINSGSSASDEGAMKLEDGFEDALQALQVLGFSRKDAERACREAVSRGAGASDSGSLIREALRGL